MGVAFEMVRAALWFAGRHDLANDIIAERPYTARERPRPA